MFQTKFTRTIGVAAGGKEVIQVVCSSQELVTFSTSPNYTCTLL